MKHWTLALTLAASLAAAPATLATPLAPNSSVSSIDTFNPISTPPPWVSVADTGFQSVAVDGFEVRMRTQVFRNTDTNFLDFIYSVENLQFEAIGSSLNRITVSAFPSASFTDVYFLQESGVQPAGAERALDGTITFHYEVGNLIDSGETSALVVRTYSTHYQAGTLGALDPEGTLASAASYVPTEQPSVVPLPGSLMLGLSGLVTLAGGLFRRFRRGLTPAL